MRSVVGVHGARVGARGRLQRRRSGRRSSKQSNSDAHEGAEMRYPGTGVDRDSVSAADSMSRTQATKHPFSIIHSGIPGHPLPAATTPSRIGMLSPQLIPRHNPGGHHSRTEHKRESRRTRKEHTTGTTTHLSERPGVAVAVAVAVCQRRRPRARRRLVHCCEQ